MKKLLLIAMVLVVVSCKKKTTIEDIVVDDTSIAVVTKDDFKLVLSAYSKKDMVSIYKDWTVSWFLHKNYNHPFGYVIITEILKGKTRYITQSTIENYIDFNTKEIIVTTIHPTDEMGINQTSISDNYKELNPIYRTAEDIAVLSYTLGLKDVSAYKTKLKEISDKQEGRQFGVVLTKAINLNY